MSEEILQPIIIEKLSCRFIRANFFCTTELCYTVLKCVASCLLKSSISVIVTLCLQQSWKKWEIKMRNEVHPSELSPAESFCEFPQIRHEHKILIQRTDQNQLRVVRASLFKVRYSSLKLLALVLIKTCVYCCFRFIFRRYVGDDNYADVIV